MAVKQWCPKCKKPVASPCQQCKKSRQKSLDKRRGTAASRGYGWKWQQYSLAYRREHLLCVMCLPVCTPSACVDHIVAVTGADDPRFWDETNHQALCWSCHSVKTAAEDGSFGRAKK